MKDNIFWLLEGAIKSGELENFMAVMNKMVVNTQTNEPDVVNYEWFISEDKKSCYIYERYANSAAVLKHAQNGAEDFQQLITYMDITSIKVFGNPSDEVKQLLSGLGATFMTPIGGFIR